MAKKKKKAKIKKITTTQAVLLPRVFDLVLGRVIKSTYLSLGAGAREDMEKVFLSDDDNAKGEFIKKYIPDFKKLFKEEAEKIEEEIRAFILS